MTRDELLGEYFRLTRTVLPARAAREGWVVRNDHCFQRIVLDNVVGDAWRNVLTSKRQPAYKQLTEEQAEAAAQLAREIEQHGNALLRTLNDNSLRWRGKTGRPANQEGCGE